MSEADRARERVDFEAAAEAIEKGKEKVIPSSVLLLPGMNEQRFVSATQLEVDNIIYFCLLLVACFLPN
jgi:G patch domain-containing protein 1